MDCKLSCLDEILVAKLDPGLVHLLSCACLVVSITFEFVLRLYHLICMLSCLIREIKLKLLSWFSCAC
jgi:hypothetical protein